MRMRLRPLALTLATVVLALSPALAASQTMTPAQIPSATAAPADPEADADRAAPVLLEGEPILWITVGAGPYSAALRADRISRRIEDAVHDRSLRDPTITVTEVDQSSELRAGSRLLMVVTARDAASLGASRTAIAQHYAVEIETAIRTERLRYAPTTLIRSGVYGVIATVALLIALWLASRASRRIQHVLTRALAPRSQYLRLMQAELLPADRLARTVITATRATRALLTLLAIDLYLTYVLGLFPWTRAASHALFGYVMTPVEAAATAFVGYLPNLLFLVVIGGLIYASIRLVALFFRQVADGRLAFASFPAEWADPTNKIVRVLLIAFGLVVAFPYLPAANSPAFAGVSVFLGILISLASSSALSNMIAGIVLTYTGAFRMGDIVKLGDSFGTIVETALLATHIRTLKNEEVTIPNSIVLGSAVVNYSRGSKAPGLVLHTSVTIGYDAPWHRVHELLVSAALRVPDVLHDPPPFVWQTALNDFYVTYEINAYTSAPEHMMATYAALHAAIQDTFFEAGVEIMSPHYTAVRDGNVVAIPEALRAPGYQPSAFRIADTGALGTGAVSRERR